MQIVNALLVWLAVISCAETAGEVKHGARSRILIYPYGHCLNSHLLNAERLAEILLEDGHDISFLTSDVYTSYDHLTEGPLKSPHFHLVQFEAPKDHVPICDYDTVDYVINVPLKIRFHAFIQTAVRYCDAMLGEKGFLEKLKNASYDLLILEAVDPCSRILADYLDVPFIPLSTTGLGHKDNNIRLPSYLPAPVAPFTSQMSFIQRVLNVFIKTAFDVIPTVMGFEESFEELKVKYDLNTSVSLANTFDRAAVKFVNSDFSLEYAAPLEPDTILVGGFAIPKAKPLSAELEAFMESSGEHGVILMSFGTVTKRYDAHMTKIFADAFARLPQKIIMRYYPDTDSEQVTFTDNVKLMKWLPQVDILAHPKCRVIISHCGLNGLFEAGYHGVPILGIPLFGDQIFHSVKVEKHLGMAASLDIHTLSSDSVYEALLDLVTNPVYKSNGLLVSQRMRDQLMTPQQKIKFWTDYVVRNKGAPHLKTAGRTLTWYQYYSLDVLAFYTCLLLFAIYLIILAIRGLITFVFRRVPVMVHFTKMKSC